MKRKRRNARPVNSVQNNSVVLGLLHDIWVLLRLIVSLLSWPAKTLARAIHNSVKHHPALRSKHTHTMLCVGIGLATLLVSFVIEHYSSHPVWSASVETMRAAGVCPIWESLAAAMSIGSKV